METSVSTQNTTATRYGWIYYSLVEGSMTKTPEGAGGCHELNKAMGQTARGRGKSSTYTLSQTATSVLKPPLRSSSRVPKAIPDRWHWGNKILI